MGSTETGQHWWGVFPIPLGQGAAWRIGPLHLKVRRTPWAWSLAWSRTAVWTDAGLAVAEPFDPAEADTPEYHTARFAFGETADPLELRPRLADRAVIATPEAPFHLLPDEQCLAYVSTPLWMAVHVGQERRLAVEVPVVRPPDSWFGKNLVEGELCYGSRTAMRLQADQLPRLHHRAVIPVLLQNRGGDSLLVERVRLPVPHLPLLLAADGRCFTPTVQVRRERGGVDRVTVLDGPPPAVGEMRALAPAREPGALALVAQAFSSLFNR
jgi:hypothetical protein